MTTTTTTKKHHPGRPPNPDPEMRGVYYRKPWEVKFGKVRVGSFATREEAVKASKEWRENERGLATAPQRPELD